MAHPADTDEFSSSGHTLIRVWYSNESEHRGQLFVSQRFFVHDHFDRCDKNSCAIADPKSHVSRKLRGSHAYCRRVEPAARKKTLADEVTFFSRQEVRAVTF
ncbi:MAG: hypothetical protein M3451_08105, partial [Chloroflexota bacterium]|nr:hypothetical protein [Chloroflexota bacterium]